MECGVPRDDIFFAPPPGLVEEVKASLNVPSNNRLVMYAPTFRTRVEDNLSTCRLDFDRILDAIEKKFGGTWTMAIRVHPNLALKGISTKLFTPSARLVDATLYPDIQELLVAADITISDYSSVMIDSMLQRKPTFIIAKDIETYPKERGLKQFYFELPIAHNKSEEELLECIAQHDEQSYRTSVDEFMSKIKSFDDGHASERVVDRIVEVINRSSAPKIEQSLEQIERSSDARIEHRELVRDMYRDEVRDGFFVNVARKKLWNVQLELILEVDRLCRKHGLKYFAGYGTLLGAVRHKGFIPWDDDVDLVMLRPDYERFVEIASKELRAEFFLDLYYNYAVEGEPNLERLPLVTRETLEEIRRNRGYWPTQAGYLKLIAVDTSFIQ